MTVPSRIFLLPFWVSLTTLLLKLHLWENAWAGDGEGFVCTEPRTNTFPSPLHFITVAVGALHPHKEILWNTFNFRFPRTFPIWGSPGNDFAVGGFRKGRGWRWSACTIFLHRISWTTDRKQWLPASPCRGRDGAGPAIWKSIIPGLTPASFTSEDLVSASSVRSEFGGPYSGSIMQFHLTKQLSEASPGRKACLLTLCLPLWLFPGLCFSP